MWWARRGPPAGADGPRPARPKDAGASRGSLFDLGVSSLQLDRAERGFSYRLDVPLDMRMDVAEPTSALAVVNETDETELAEWFRASGEGRLARRLARAIVAARPISTTAGLAQVVTAAVPAPARAARQSGDPGVPGHPHRGQ